MLQVTRIWKKQPGKYFAICTRSATKKWATEWFSKDEFSSVGDFVRDNLDKDVYFCPHGFTKKVRQKPFAVAPRLLYADLDESDPEDLELTPTIAFESSPGRYVGFWLTDEPTEEALNRRLAYSISADISGWDWTQVLRVPNTRNYKYNNQPRVRILWNDGPTYKTSELERKIPMMRNVMGDDIGGRSSEIFKRYEKKLPRWVRRELISGKPVSGQRSDVIWKLQNELLEAGLSREETFELIWVCPWNKFRDRNDGAEQLWRELDKALDNHLAGGYTAKGGDDDRDPLAFNPLKQSMADVEMRNIDWLVPGMFARGEVTIIEGDPGLGKSYMTQIIAGSICDGKKLPTEEDYEAPQGRVAYFDTENTADTVTKQRLIENGIEHLENYWQEESPFSIDDEERWEKVVEALDKLRPSLGVFDTINTYIGNADTYRSSETQQALGYFKELATRFNMPVVLLRHLTKNSGNKALYRGQGSIAFTGVARVVWTVGLHPDDQDIRVVACTKNNIGPKGKSFTFRIDGLPNTEKAKNRSKFTWGEFVDLSADDIVSVAPIKNNDRESAIKWLKEALENSGRLSVTKIQRMAEARSISKTNLTRAAESLGVTKTTQGEGRSKLEFWSLRSGDQIPDEKESRGRTRRLSSTKRSVNFSKTASGR